MQDNISPLQKAGCFLINFYQKFISPITGNQCRFYPTCSEYTKQAIIIHGFWLGCVLGFYRILRCNPLSQGGFDPVPDKFHFSKRKK